MKFFKDFKRKSRNPIQEGFVNQKTVNHLIRKNHLILKSKYHLNINKVLLCIIFPVILLFFYYIYQLWANYKKDDIKNIKKPINKLKD